MRTPPLVARTLALSAALSLGISVSPTAGAQVITGPTAPTARMPIVSDFVPPRFEAPPAHPPTAPCRGCASSSLSTVLI